MLRGGVVTSGDRADSGWHPDRRRRCCGTGCGSGSGQSRPMINARARQLEAALSNPLLQSTAPRPRRGHHGEVGRDNPATRCANGTFRALAATARQLRERSLEAAKQVAASVRAIRAGAVARPSGLPARVPGVSGWGACGAGMMRVTVLPVRFRAGDATGPCPGRLPWHDDDQTCRRVGSARSARPSASRQSRRTGIGGGGGVVRGPHSAHWSCS